MSWIPPIVLDVTISALVTYRLSRAKTNSHQGTRRLLNKLIAINFEAAVPPTLSLLVALVLVGIPVSLRQQPSLALVNRQVPS